MNRYDFMEVSKVTDEDGMAYYDPLSVDYSKLKLSEIPTVKTITAADIEKFYLYMYNNYGEVSLDDILLLLNGIGYVGELEPGSTIFNFSKADLQNFNAASE